MKIKVFCGARSRVVEIPDGEVAGFSERWRASVCDEYAERELVNMRDEGWEIIEPPAEPERRTAKGD